MGKKSQPKAPAPPDPEKTIQAEAEANRVNTYTPYGSQTFTQNADGSWRTDISPNERVQAMIDRQFDMAGAEPSSFSSGGMPAGVQERLSQQLGGVSNPEYSSTQFGAVEMPAPQQASAPQQPVQQPSVGVPRKPSVQGMRVSPGSKDKVEQR